MKYQLIEVRRDINTSRTNNVRTLSAILFMIRAAPLLPGLLWELLWPALITEKPQSLTWANNTGLDLGLTGRSEQHHLPDVTNLYFPLCVTGMYMALMDTFFLHTLIRGRHYLLSSNQLFNWLRPVICLWIRGPSINQQLQHGSHRGFILKYLEKSQD